MAAIPTVVSMKALPLCPIVRKWWKQGGYTIQFSGSVPKGAKVRLLIGSDEDSVDITPHYLPSHLKVILDVLSENDYWSKTGTRYVDCQVAAYLDNEMIPGSLSNKQRLPCPVEPVEVEHLGTIAALTELGAVDPPLNYVKDGPGCGRLLTDAINGRYYFIYGGQLEIDPGNRGFDCTSFVGSALGRHDGMAGTSADFADSIGAKTDVLKDVHLKDIRKFMGDNPVGAYLMWNNHHIVTLINGVVREFNIPSGKPGYRETDIDQWHTSDIGTKYTLRELPASFLVLGNPFFNSMVP